MGKGTKVEEDLDTDYEGDSVVLIMIDAYYVAEHIILGYGEDNPSLGGEGKHRRD